MSDVHRIRYRFPKLGKKQYGIFMHTVESALGFGSNEKAQFRYHCINFYHKYGWLALHDAFPQVSRASLYRWKQRYLSSGKKLNSLVPESTRPKHIRQMSVPARVLGFIKSLREQYPHISKYKLKPFLDEFCVAQGIETYSVSWIGKVLERYQLFFGKRQRLIKRRRNSRRGYTIKRTPNPDTVDLGYLQVDGITVYWGGRKLLFLTAIELKTRSAWAKLVSHFSSYQAREFVKGIIDQVPYAIHTIHTDNGSEFHALFDETISQLQLLHLWSPARTPKVHAHIERFNGTIQREFIDYHVDDAVMHTDMFRTQLADWMSWYNTKRPHHALNLMSPYQYLIHLQKGGSLKSP